MKIYIHLTENGQHMGQSTQLRGSGAERCPIAVDPYSERFLPVAASTLGGRRGRYCLTSSSSLGASTAGCDLQRRGDSLDSGLNLCCRRRGLSRAGSIRIKDRILLREHTNEHTWQRRLK